MGRVFRAVHAKLGRQVAIKLLRRSHADEDGVRRFLREARVVNRVRHPHLVEITDIVPAAPGGDSYYVMEWLEGKDLHARMVECGGRIPLPELLRVAVDVADALAAAHGAGLIHRDLKPHNIYLLERDERRAFAKVIDFGVARDAATPDEDEGCTVGTPAYMAPEQAAGAPGDQRSDVYALGIVLYEMAAGRMPFAPPAGAGTAGVTMAETRTVTASAAAPSSQAPRTLPRSAHIPGPLMRVIRRCTAQEPADRYQEMGALCADLLAARETLSRWRHVRSAAIVLCGTAVLWSGWQQRGMVLEPAARLSKRVASAMWRRPRSATTPQPDQGHLTLEVRVSASPEGTTIYYMTAEASSTGWRRVGTTPCVIHIPEGRQVIELRRAGYRTERRIVDVRVGASLSVRLVRTD